MTEVFGMDSSLCRCTLYADNSIKKTHQTTVTISAILVDSHTSVAMM